MIGVFLFGLLFGFLIGGYVMFFDHKSKVRKGMTPFIGVDDSLQWK